MPDRVRYMFDSLESAAEGLETVLVDARKTKAKYQFAGISADQILKSGLILEGDIQKIDKKLHELDGSAKFVE